MRVVSGAGEFEISVERIELRSGNMVLIGKMGVWEAETFIDTADIGTIARLSANPRVLVWMARQPFASLRQRLRRRRVADDAE
jgi:hypothetical protein